MQHVRLPLRAVGYQEDDLWIAHCLELDIVGQGANPKLAFEQMVELVVAQIEDAMNRGDLDSIFHSAPPEIWSLFATTEDVPKSESEFPEPVERIDYRALCSTG